VLAVSVAILVQSTLYLCVRVCVCVWCVCVCVCVVCVCVVCVCGMCVCVVCVCGMCVCVVWCVWYVCFQMIRLKKKSLLLAASSHRLICGSDVLHTG